MGSVLDSRLRVLGLQGLRVADGSVMPRLIGANTNAAIVMIGEKAADMIIEDWGRIGKHETKTTEQGREELYGKMFDKSWLQ